MIASTGSEDFFLRDGVLGFTSAKMVGSTK